MIRGWDGDQKRFNDDTDMSPPPPPPPPPYRQGLSRDAADSNRDDNQHSVQLQIQEVAVQEGKGLFQEWERDNGYEELNDEIMGEDPLASPGNSSLNSGNFGGWSLTEGLTEKESIGIPFNDDDDEECNENKNRKSHRMSSPRESHFKTHGLSMVKEVEQEEDADNNGANPKSPGGAIMFDDVDLEASPKNLPTANNNGHNNHHRSRISMLGNRGKITSRVLQELQTNPKLKYQAIVAFSMILVLSVLLGVVVTASSGNKQPLHNEESQAKALTELLDVVAPMMTLTPSNVTSSSPSIKLIVKPTVKATTAPFLEPTVVPTFNPTIDPTSSKTSLSPSSNPTEPLTTLIPSFSPTSKLPTLLPSTSPVTMVPTRDCTDSSGDFKTYNDKPRTCEWLDNGHNGAASSRKDLDCLFSELGDACRYTCRLYNGCMEYLLSSLSDYTYENDVSVGDPCADKEGSFISNGLIPRECSWLEEDPETAAAKKNLNCGTKDIPKTELGSMCPGSCSGYNSCEKSIYESVERVSPRPLTGLNDQADVEEGVTPTTYPTLSSSNELAMWPSDESITSEDLCQDNEGEYLTHRGKYRQCRWLNQDDIDTAEEKKELNCRKTEIGFNCLETCPCDILEEDFDIVRADDAASVPPTLLPTLQPTLTYDAAADDLTEDLIDKVLDGGNENGFSSMAEQMGVASGAMDYPTLLPTLQPTLTHDATADDLTEDLMDKVLDGGNENGFSSMAEQLGVASGAMDYPTLLPTLQPTLSQNANAGELAEDFIEMTYQLDEGAEDVEQLDVRGEAAAIFFGGIPTFSPMTTAPTPHPESKGVFNDSGDILTLTVFADASVSQRDGDENFGDNERLNVENDPYGGGMRERQSLLLFDLTFVAKSFGNVVGKATLRIYLVNGSDLGGVVLKKMTYTNWTEDDVTWNTAQGGNGLDEPTISFVDSINNSSWYDIDTTAAVRDALENGESHIGIRIVSDDKVDVYFASKERITKQPLLIVDSRTIDPTIAPTKSPFDYTTLEIASTPPTQAPTSSPPTQTPSKSPVLALDCMDKRGKFVTHTGESQPCSWLDVGNGSLKKELNCQDQSEAALFCQATCSASNGCDDMHCIDMAGTYVTHTGWTAECTWLLTGQGALKLEQNCGGIPDYPITELGKRCQATCGDYNGCNTSV